MRDNADMAETIATRVLVVEDEDAVRDAIERALTLEGYAVETAPTGERALYTLEEGGSSMPWCSTSCFPA